jgi:sigma-B regulation protein RsbU (phosphoserine phosphatase)
MKELLVKLHFPARAERLCLVRNLVRQVVVHAGCNPGLADRLVLAVNEACMNVIQHAYKGEAAGEIVMEILNNGGELCFRLTDFAEPIDLEHVRPRDLGKLRPGGLGVHFISEIMDRWEMGHLENGRGNYLEMAKRITGE